MQHPPQTSASNPVTRRVAMLSSHWLDFASEEKARVLCWQLRPDETRMLEAFLALQLDDRTAEHADLFVPLDSPFTSPEAYPTALCEAFIQHYERDRTQLLEEGLEAGWFAPTREASETGDAYLSRCLEAFATHHQLPAHLVLVLQPSRIDDAAAYEGWLLHMAAALPERLRLVVVDLAGAPAWPRLAEPSDGRVTIREAALDMPGALQEISQGAGKLDTPGGQLRDSFLRLSEALSAQDLPRALRAGQGALAITAAQRWFHLSVPIHAMLGSALAADGQKDGARQQFESAEQSALRGELEGAPDSRDACKKLRLQSRLGLGSALIQCEDFAAAARIFEDTIPIASEQGDSAVQLDCFRLGAFCHARAEAPGRAFDAARAGLELAKSMPRETLALTNFSQLAAAVLELCEPAGQNEQRPALERAIEALTAEPGPPDRDLARGAA